MSHAFAVIIESLVAILLTITISYCIVLNKRLMRLKADEHALKATISELITATEIAERAITGLKLTVRECDQNLGERLRTAERFCADIERQLAAGAGTAGAGDATSGRVALTMRASRSITRSPAAS